MVNGVLCMSCHGSIPALTPSTVGSFSLKFECFILQNVHLVGSNISASYTDCKMDLDLDQILLFSTYPGSKVVRVVSEGSLHVRN